MFEKDLGITQPINITLDLDIAQSIKNYLQHVLKQRNY